MGIVFTGMFAVGLVLFSRIETDQHLSHILFGDMLGVTWQDLIETAVIALGTLLIVLAKRRDFLLYAFDPQHARAIGLPVKLLHYGLLALLSITIVASLKAVGIILVVAMLIAPGAIGFLLAKRFEAMLAIAMTVAIASGVLGTLISFSINGATGPCIVLIQSAVFLVALLFAPGSGLLRKRAAS
jgi:manganese/iron transport system permease protein